MTVQGDLPDWSVLVIPNLRSASAGNQGSGLIVQLLSSATPYRIWVAWVDVSLASNTLLGGLPVTWGAQIGDGGGNPLVRSQRHIAAVSHEIGGSLSIAMNGYTPIQSAGQYTTNLVTDAGITNLFTRSSGGILYSIP